MYAGRINKLPLIPALIMRCEETHVIFNIDVWLMNPGEYDKVPTLRYVHDAQSQSSSNVARQVLFRFVLR